MNENAPTDTAEAYPPPGTTGIVAAEVLDLLPVGAVVSVPEQATGGTIPDCCDHTDMEQGHCHACYDTGHAHDPARPCPPTVVDEIAGGAA